MIEVRHQIPRKDVMLGIVRAENVSLHREATGFEARLKELLAQRSGALSEREDRVRLATRDMLRNRRYKPTGRGKPASEYLLRAAEAGDAASFPRINAPVDACNYISLKYLVPISLWDLDLACADRFVFRLGTEGESYVFNTAGQEIELQDLIVGCRVRVDDSHGEPIVNPVKDSMATKTCPATARVAACIYFPGNVFSTDDLQSVCREFADLLTTTSQTITSVGLVPPDTVATV